jgi:hypothetical protein|tara:strand:- start:382 stop:924 length:543 start_codon:yes stop_codon:yes gene_type:complete
MSIKKYNLLKELLYWSYSNLVMIHVALKEGTKTLEVKHYKIRSRFYKEFINGKRKIGSFIKEYDSLKKSRECAYCGNKSGLTLDHIFPKKIIKWESSDNIIFACKKCNSSKGKKDLLEWYHGKSSKLSITAFRRYLKLSIDYCKRNNLMEIPLELAKDRNLPFSIDYLEENIPNISKLKL